MKSYSSEYIELGVNNAKEIKQRLAEVRRNSNAAFKQKMQFHLPGYAGALVRCRGKSAFGYLTSDKCFPKIVKLDNACLVTAKILDTDS